MPPNQSSRQSVLHPFKKKQKKQEPSRFLPCPVCHRSFPSYCIHDHVNLCLDSHATRSSIPSSPSTTLPSSSCNSQRLPLISNAYGQLCSNTVDEERDANSTPHRVQNSPVEQDCTNALLAISRSATALSSNNEIQVLSSFSKESSDGRDGGARMPEDEAFGSYQNTQDCHQTNCDGSSAGDLVQSPKATEIIIVPELRQEDHCYSPRLEESVEEIESKAQDVMTLPGENYVPGKAGLGLQIFQVQRQSQAKLSMLCKFPMSAALKRKPTITVLQPGMVLFRSWLPLDTQQRLVNESQTAAHLFKRPTTAGGGKYHLWQMSFGCHWDSKKRRYIPQDRCQPFPVWMYNLGKELASDAHNHTCVYAHGSNFAPDVALVNFYPVKDEELGVVGLGGHQDLDDYCDMPVVSVSVGDSMTFFYRRLPPQSRRKSGIQIVVDESAAKTCKDGDTAHNSEQKIILESGDVLVFGGESRLAYHGTRSVQPGTRPPGLHMVPGRLNFTFRQCNAPRSS